MSFVFGRKYKNHRETMSEQMEELSRLFREGRVVITTATQRPIFHSPPVLTRSSGIHPTYGATYIRRTNNDMVIIDHMNLIS